MKVVTDKRPIVPIGGGDQGGWTWDFQKAQPVTARLDDSQDCSLLHHLIHISPSSVTIFASILCCTVNPRWPRPIAVGRSSLGKLLLCDYTAFVRRTARCRNNHQILPHELRSSTCGAQSMSPAIFVQKNILCAQAPLSSVRY